MDRTCLAVQAEDLDKNEEIQTQVFVIPIGEEAWLSCLKITRELRAKGIGTEIAFDNRSIKAAMKNADRSGAKFALIMGEAELSSNSVVIKNLVSGEQETIALDLTTNHFLNTL